MVELRKRPQRDPPAPAPAPKKSRATKAKAVPAPAPAEPAAESSTAAEPAPTGVVGKAKRAASKVKEAVTGTVETSESGATESAAKQPAVEDESPTAVETGETGMIPETAGTAPSTTTVPGTETGSANAGAASTAAPAPVAATTEGKRQRGKAKPTEASVPPTAAAPVAASESATGAAASTADFAAAPPTGTGAKPIRGKAKAPTPVAGVISPPPAPAASAPVAEAAPAPVPVAAPAPATAPTEEFRPPATEDLENPPETGKVDTSTATPSTAEPASTPLSPASVGKSIPTLTTFGGPSPLETHTGTKLTFADLLSQSTSGVIIFTYPRASTPGCTQQACSFRDNHDVFAKESGYTIYGLSTDSVKANMGFATKQGLQYPLLCDTSASLTGALGMKKAGNAKGTLRGVVVVDKAGVVRVWFQGGPAKTVDAVKEFLAAAKQ